MYVESILINDSGMANNNKTDILQFFRSPAIGRFSPAYIIFILSLAGVILNSIILRFSLPAITLLDGDVSGYLDPALDILEGKGWSPESYRGIFYPGFVWIDIFLFDSINSVAVVQQILAVAGLLLFASGYMNMFREDFSLIRQFYLLLALMILGWNQEMIRLEHTLRPEGLTIFFAGSVFFLLQQIIFRPDRFVFTLLVLLAVVMFQVQQKFVMGGLIIILCAGYVYIKKKPQDNKWPGILMAIIAGVYIFGWIFIVLYWAYLYAKRLQFRDVKSDLVLGGLIIFLIYSNASQVADRTPVSSFMAKNFFYVNCRLIERSKAFEQCFNNNEKGAVRLAVSYIDTTNVWELVGYNADQLIYGPVAPKVESRYGTGIYKRVMLKSVVFCFPEFIHKILVQMNRYYFDNSFTERIPQLLAIDFRPEVISALRNLNGLHFHSSDYVEKYQKKALDYLSNTDIEKKGFMLERNIIRLLLVHLSRWLILIAAVYCFLSIVLRRIDILTTIFLAHFFVLLTVAVVHTIDIGRYSHALFGFFVLINLLIAERITTAVLMFIQNRRHKST